ncbi:MAG: serine/threonine protein kinase [Pseudomonadota bacterium]
MSDGGAAAVIEHALRSGTTIHGSTIVLGTRGVLIIGASGAGKSTLAQALVDDALEGQSFSCWVSDDRTHLHPAAKRIVLSAPAPIAGLREAPFLGVVETPFQPKALLDAVVELVPEEELDRMADLGRVLNIAGVSDTWAVPLLRAPCRQTDQVVSLIKSFLAKTLA